MILNEDAYVECSLYPTDEIALARARVRGHRRVRHSVCQALNPNLDMVTIRGIIKPSEFSFSGSPDKGNFEIKITDYKSEILSVDRPEDSFNLDDQCPAGYDWKMINLKFTAFFRLFTIDDIRAHPEKVGEINRMVKRLFDARASGVGSCNGDVEG